MDWVSVSILIFITAHVIEIDFFWKFNCPGIGLVKIIVVSARVFMLNVEIRVQQALCLFPMVWNIEPLVPWSTFEACTTWILNGQSDG